MSEEDDDEIPQGKILSAPETIYLVIGELDGQDVEFRDLEDVSWCDDSVYRDDIRYVRATPLVDAAPNLLKALEAWLEESEKDHGSSDVLRLRDTTRAAIAKATKGEL